MIADRALFDLQNELTFSRNVYKGYNSEFKSVGRFKKGNSVTIALPNKFRTKTGPTLDVVDVQEGSTTITVDEHQLVGMDFLETDLTFEIEDFSRKYIRPATIALANKVDADGCEEYVNVYNMVGTPGTTPSTFGVLADAAVRFSNEAIPKEDRVAVLSPKALWSLADGELKGVFAPGMVESLLRKGFSGRYALMDFFEDQNITTHTVGAHSGTPVMNGATAEGATALNIDGWPNTTTVLKKGDIFTIAGVYGVNPVSGKVWEGNELRQFVVTADAISNGSGETAVSIAPKIYSSAATEDYLPYQTVGTLPANGAAITVVGTLSTGYPQNLLFHPNCFALTMVPFERPKSAGQSVMWAQASDPQMGLSITVATAYDITNYKENTRLDILYGWDTPQPEYGIRLVG